MLRTTTTTTTTTTFPDPQPNRTVTPTATAERDTGHTILELIVVVLVLGLIASVAAFAVGGMRADAAESGCAADHRGLATAAEAYVAEHGTAPMPATGADHDRFERTLVDAGLLRAVSTYHDLDAAGVIGSEGNSPC